MSVNLLLTILLICLTIGSDGVSQCSGKWIQGGNDTHIEPFIGLNRSVDEETEMSELLKSICPVETFYSSCYYHGITERANRIMRRKWELLDLPSNTGCIPFSPQAFLEQIRHRHLYLSGDNVMRQIWQSLVCRLLSATSVSPSDMDVQFVEHSEPPLFTAATCPLGADHCALAYYASVRFPAYGASITHRFEGRYEPGLLHRYIADKNINADDILIYNVGSHYETQGELEANLKALVTDLVSLREHASKGLEVAKLLKFNFYFMETAPQHYARPDGAPNGYYDKRTAAEWCEPLKYEFAAHKADWRNRMVDEHLQLHNVPIIRIADALYSQFDTHIDGDSKLVKFPVADCTHFCSPGPVFEYVNTQMLNALRSKK